MKKIQQKSAGLNEVYNHVKLGTSECSIVIVNSDSCEFVIIDITNIVSRFLSALRSNELKLGKFSECQISSCAINLMRTCCSLSFPVPFPCLSVTAGKL